MRPGLQGTRVVEGFKWWNGGVRDERLIRSIAKFQAAKNRELLE
jgi:hypothetical protein